MCQIVPTIKIRKWKETEFDQKEVSKEATGARSGKRLCPWLTGRFCSIEAPQKYWETMAVMLCVI
jgi:hypothetical protein